MKKLLSWLLSTAFILTAVAVTTSTNVYAAGFVRQEMYADMIPFTTISQGIVETGSKTCSYLNETLSETFEHAIRQDTVDNISTDAEMSSLVFDIEGAFPNGAVFYATPGIMSGDKYKYGDAVFIISVDGAEAARSEVVSYKSEKKELSAIIPKGAKKLTLSVDCYDNTACDWTVWGNPVFKENIPEKSSSAVYFSDLSYTAKNPVLNDFGAYQMRVREKYYIEFENSIFQHAHGSQVTQLTYDVSGKTSGISTFSSYVGLCAYYNGFVGTANGAAKGSVKFNVYADGKLIAETQTVTLASPATYIEVQLPEGTKAITLEVSNADGNNDSDWALWGDPKIVNDSIYLSDMTATKYNSVLYSAGELPMMVNYSTKETRSYSHGIFWHAGGPNSKSALEYNISAYTENGATFKTDIGFLADYNGAALGNEGSYFLNVYIDGVLAARSDEIVIKSNPISSISVALPAGASKIKLEIDPGKSNSCDWSMFGNPCIIENKYRIAVPESKTLSLGECFEICVEDIATGNMVENASVSAYSSHDAVAKISDGVVTATAEGFTKLDITAGYNGYVMKDSIYINVRSNIYDSDKLTFLSDMNEISVTSASFNKDAGYNEKVGTGLHFYNGENFTAFEKGIFTHADSTVTYDISGTEAEYFHAFIGIEKYPDFNEGSASSVKFSVYADNTLIYESDEKLITSDLEEILVALPENASTLELVCSKGASNSCDHSAWADAALVDIGDAVVDGIAYSTVYEAVDVAKNGDTVKLRNDITVNEILVIGEGVTFDIGSYRINGNADVKLSADAKAVSDYGMYGNFTAENLVGENVSGGKYTYIASPYSEEDISFTGAQIRTEGEQGLRFIYRVNTPLENCELSDYGVILIPCELGAGDATTENTDDIGMVSKRTLGESFNYFENSESRFAFNICIIGVSPKRYGVKFTSRGFVRFTDGDTEYTVYTSYSDKNNLSILDVAEHLAENEEYKALYEQIVNDYNTSLQNA